MNPKAAIASCSAAARRFVVAVSKRLGRRRCFIVTLAGRFQLPIRFRETDQVSRRNGDMSARRGPATTKEATMRRGGLSAAGLSILFALGLAAWEVYFFWFAGSLKSTEGTLGMFTPDRVGFNLAWIAAIYLTFQLLSIPFSLPSSINRFIGVVDGMASLVPLAVVLIVAFGETHLLNSPQKWEAAILLIFITMVDLFGGYTFNIALSRRTMDVAQGGAL
jgi:hypothetical protein